MAVNPNRRNPHACPHNRYLLSFVSTRIAEHISHCIHLFWMLQISLCNVFCSERIARHQNSFRKISLFRIVMRGWYIGHILSS